MRKPVSAKREKVLSKAKAVPAGVLSTVGDIAQDSQNTPETQFPVVAIGASAGGLEAMIEFLKNLPSDTGMAFIYVQHLSPDHKSMLTQLLSKATKMKVQEIDNMDKIRPDNVFVIPHNRAIEVTDGHIKLIPRPANSSAISIDILFKSLAKAQKERVIGIILSGSAGDGAKGIKYIKQEGGLTFAQDNSAKFGSMPQTAVATGFVDYILSPKEIARELARLSKHPLIFNGALKNGREYLIENDNPDLQNILRHLNSAVNVDFRVYKMNTIKRRIIRRMLLHKIKSLKEYGAILIGKKEETDILFQDLLINVTGFFRDTDTHKYLKDTLLPRILKNKKNGATMRIWVPACSTGEEAFSIAIMLLELLDSKSSKIGVQIFATDISSPAIAKARAGSFSKQDLENVSPKRIQRFFSKTELGFRISKQVREMCVFAPHNILNDPPFSRIDLISCCNLFIYLDTIAQNKAVATFHYALVDDGYLMLGKSESISSSQKFFSAENKKFKIFSRNKYSQARTMPAFSASLNGLAAQRQNFEERKSGRAVTSATKPSFDNSSLDTAIDGVLISQFMPASVVINHSMEILLFRGSTDLYFTHAAGKATLNILKMARPEIAFDLRTVISNAIKTKGAIKREGIEMKGKASLHIIGIEAVPLEIEWEEPLLLVLFTDHEQPETINLNGKNTNLAMNDKDRKIKKLEEELAAVETGAVKLAQEQEAFREELQSANEEVVSSNEELQTMNEELETSKEEIESVNEELRTTNEEMRSRNELLNESYEYAEAVIATIHDPMLILDKDLRVKSANKTFYQTFAVKETETEGLLVYDLGNGQWDIPNLRVFLEKIILKNTYIHNFEVTHRFPHLGEKTMLLNASRIIQKAHHEQLILLIIEDVSEVRNKTKDLQQKEKQLRAQATIDHKAEKEKLEHAVAERTKELQELNEALAKSEERYHRMIDEVQDYAIIFLNKEGIIENWNEGAEKIKGYKAEEIIGRSFTVFYTQADRDSALPQRLLNQALDKGRAALEGWRLRKDGTLFWGSIVITALHDGKNNVIGFSKVTRDLTARKIAEDKLKQANEQLTKNNNDLLKMNKELEAFTYVSSHDLQEPLRKIQIFASRIMENQNKMLDDQSKDYFKRMQDAAARMQALIHDLLSFSRLNKTENQFEITSLTGIIGEVEKELEEKITEKNALIEVHGKGDIKLIPFQFRQLVQNLVTNALKFSISGKSPHLIITIEDVQFSKSDIPSILPDKRYCLVSFTDNGIGFEKEYSEKIFEVFQKLHGRDEFPGTGIGLAIVKKIVENHNGVITASGELGKGARFDIYIPH